MKPVQPVFFLTAFLLLVGLACATISGGGTAPTEAPLPAPTQEPVQIIPTATEPEPEPTQVPATEAPSATQTEEAPAASEFFREEFDSQDALANWDSFSLGSGEDRNLVIEQEGDHLLFDLGDKNLYVYYMYKPHEYDDVSIRLNAENRGRNNNNVSLVCRMNSEGTQWYEFSVESGGLWYLYAVDKKYNIVANGGTNALKQGREVNEYAMTCKGDEIALFVNGEEIRSVSDKTYGFNRGLVGFNISSLNVLPITVEVNWFEISQP